ncbi:FtsX-like permease family protein, partial [Candidatus Dojkabacteria bacterium]|nr:FtsX-like permease family protein [Candidatus Dojkabacteria bacterium]
SILVMTLAFLVISIFGFLAYTSNLFLKYIENKPHIYVFFNTEVDEESILSLKDRWEDNSNVDFIEYTSEEEAVQEFYDSQKSTNPLAAEAIKDRTLPASLAIRLYSVEDAEEIIDVVNKEQETNEDIFRVRYSEDTINNIKDVFGWLRFGGAFIMGLLLIVVFLFTFFTVEFRTYNRSEEIGIMQLVGGSLWFIRAPFVLEGTYYGIVGAFISNMIIFGFSLVIYYTAMTSPTMIFLNNLFGQLAWPEANVLNTILAFSSTLLLGAILGTITSFIAILRYIK